MKYNSVKQSQPVILFTKPSLTQSFLLHTSLILHLHVIFLYLFALLTWNVTDLRVSDELGRAGLCCSLCLALSTVSSLLLWKKPQPLFAHLAGAHAETSNTPFVQGAPLLFLQNVNKMQIYHYLYNSDRRVILLILKIIDSSAKDPYVLLMQETLLEEPPER